MKNIGGRITLEGEAARRFFWDAFHPDPIEAARREELQREFDSKCRVIKRDANETVFEFDDDFFDMDEIFGKAILKSSPIAMARHIQELHNFDNTPVDLDVLCKELSIQILPFDLDSLSKSVKRHIHACISEQPGAQVCILVRDDDKHQDARFAIALALGHHFLGHFQEQESRIIVCFSKDATLRAAAAKKFAMELLIPHEALMREYKSMVIPTIELLAEKLAVPKSLMAEYLERHDLIAV